MNIKVSFVIITWNGLHYVKELFKSMGSIIARDDVETILVDNGSEDGTADFVKKFYPSTTILRLSYNKGVAYARNRGTEISSGKYIFFLDNDMIVNESAIDGIIRYMDETPDVGLAGCKLLYKDGTLQESCKKFPGFAHKVRNLLKIGKLGYQYSDQMHGTEPFEPIYLIGACQMFRREVYEQVGLLDENIFYGPEDCDFCMRVKEKGWKVMYLPQYQIIHICQRMTCAHPFSKMGLKHIIGLMYLYWKHKRIR